MKVQTRTEWPTPEDDQWAARVLLRLFTVHDVPADVGHAAVAEARLACIDSGESPAALFGAPEEYAAEVALHRVPEEWRAAADLEGAAPTDRLTMLLLGVGWLVSVLGVILFLVEGWSVDLTTARVTLALGGLVATLAIVWGMSVRHAGHIRKSWGWGALAAAGLAVAGSSVMLAPSGTVLRLPVVAVLVVGVGLLVAGMATKPGDRTVDAEALRAAPAEAWFEHLAGLLRGRYYMARTEVRGYVADARTHWADSGSEHPVDEFGSPEVYAMRLTESRARPTQGRDRALAWLWTVFAVSSAVWLVSDVVTGDVGDVSFWSVGRLILFTLMAVGAWHTVKVGRGQGGAKELAPTL